MTLQVLLTLRDTFTVSFRWKILVV